MGTFIGLVLVLVATLGVQMPRADAAPAPLRYHGKAVDGHQLLAYDERGDGRIAEVFGDLDVADRVAVVVPGTGRNLDNFYASPSAAAPRTNALALRAELQRQEPSAQVAVIAWAGYDPPERVNLDAARSERARAGGKDLARLLDELPQNRPVHLFCHSYGSVTCSYAARVADLRRKDSVTVLGSPGLDVPTAADLGTDASIWAARTDDDPIRFAPNIRVAGIGHSTDPASPDFGARVMETGSIRGHDHYYRPGTKSLTNLGRIALGRRFEVTLRHDEFVANSEGNLG